MDSLKLDSEMTMGKYSQRSPEEVTGNAQIYIPPLSDGNSGFEVSHIELSK